MGLLQKVFSVIFMFSIIFLPTDPGFSENAVKHNIQKPKAEDKPRFAPDQIVVMFRPGTPGISKKVAHAKAGGRTIWRHPVFNAELISIPDGKVFEKIAVYQKNPNIVSAQPNYYFYLHTPPTEGTDDFVCGADRYFDEQWGLHNTGQALLDPDTGTCTLTGPIDADINWLEVWESGIRGRSSIKIAVIDSGIETTHPDLPDPIETWVATLIEEAPEDIAGHGTHVAGIAAALTDNATGVAGVGINSSIGSLKAGKNDCLLFLCSVIITSVDLAEAIDHAVSEGYHIINMSLGGPEDQDSHLVRAAIENAYNAGIIIVASAGNDGSSTENFYPAAYEGVISVAAVDRNDDLASFSNFGQWVDISAPGVNILSPVLGSECGGDPDCYSWKSGTSMAGPMVAGAAALVLDQLSGPDPIVMSADLRDAVTRALLENADHYGALGQDMRLRTRYGRLNLEAAILGFNTNNDTQNARKADFDNDGDVDGDDLETFSTFFGMDGL